MPREREDKESAGTTSWELIPRSANCMTATLNLFQLFHWRRVRAIQINLQSKTRLPFSDF